MQAEAQQSHGGYLLKNHDQESTIPLLHPQNEDHHWLNVEFNRFSYKLYRSWLVLVFVIVVAAECFILVNVWIDHKKPNSERLDGEAMRLVVTNANCLFLLAGCRQMLIGMNQKKAAMAQLSIIKFQISLLLSIAELLIGIGQPEFLFSISPLQVIMFGLPLIEVLNLIGGATVITAFKKNNPLERRDHSQSMDEDLKEAVQQNEALANEIFQFDKKLATHFVIYKFWLWFCFICSTFLLCYFLKTILESAEIGHITYRICAIGYFFLNSFCSYDMIVALKRRMLNRSGRAIFLLKTLIVVTGVTLFTAVMIAQPNIVFALFTVAFVLVAPLITLKGALLAQTILEQRENFAKVACFNGDAYIHFGNL